MSAFIHPHFRFSSSYSIAVAYLPDGGTGYWSKTLTTSATHSGHILVQRTKLGAVDPIVDGHIYFNASNQLVINGLTSTAVYRDTTAFLNIFWNASGAWVNGVAVTGTGTYATGAMTNPRIAFNGTQYSNSYFADFAFWDGSSVALGGGEFDLTTGIYIPKRVTGNDYTFADWTENGTITQVTSTPTNIAATMNPLDVAGTTAEYSNGNLTVTHAAAGNAQSYSSIKMEDNTGIWYAEFIPGADQSEWIGGVLVGETRAGANRYLGQDSYTYGYYKDGRKINNASYTAYGDAYATSEAVGIEIDTDNGTINFWNEGVDQGEAFSGLSGPYYFACSCEAGGIATWNFAAPVHIGSVAGAKALTTDNLPVITDSIDNHVFIKTRNGTGAAVSITDCPFDCSAGSLVWTKSRGGANNHMLSDTARGATKTLSSNTTGAEQTIATGLTSFDSTGYTLGSNNNFNHSDGRAYVDWVFSLPNTKTSDFTGSPTITPDKVIYNNSSMFKMSIVTWTGTGANGTLPTELDVDAGLVIIKNLDNGAEDWVVGHDYLTSWGYALRLNSTVAEFAAATAFNSTAPSGGLITVGTSYGTNQSGSSMIAYVFAPCDGIKIGSYTGNGSADGPFVNAGISPVWGLFKASGTTGSWVVMDDVRDTYNPVDTFVYANSDAVENTFGDGVDYIAVGVKNRSTNGNLNPSAEAIYLLIGQPNSPTENTAR